MRVLLCFEALLIAEGIQKIMLQLAEDFHFTIVHQGSAGQQQILNFDYELLILDGDSSPATAFEILQRVKQQSSLIKVVFVFENLRSELLKAYRSGLDGCFSKKESPSEVMAALAAVLAGRVHIPQSMILDILSDGFFFTNMDARLNQLTKREVVVLKHIVQESSMKEAARMLHLAPSTLSAHKQRIMKKLGLGNGLEFNNFLRAFGQMQKSLPLGGGVKE